VLEVGVDDILAKYGSIAIIKFIRINSRRTECFFY